MKRQSEQQRKSALYGLTFLYVVGISVTAVGAALWAYDGGPIPLGVAVFAGMWSLQPLLRWYKTL